MRSVPLGHRSVLILGLAAVMSVLAFAWPLLVAPASTLADTDMAPLLFALMLAVLAVVVVADMTAGGLDSKTVAMLGVLSALGAALRPLGTGAAGIELVFFLLILGGRVFGPGFGFVLGSTTLAASALITAGVGPWLPYQMLAASWVGMGAGLLPRREGRGEIAVLIVYGIVASLAFGIFMNLSFWPFTLGPDTEISFVPGAPIGTNLSRFLAFNLITSMAWDIGRALTTSVMLLFFGGIVLRTLRRTAHRGAFHPQPSET